MLMGSQLRQGGRLWAARDATDKALAGAEWRTRALGGSRMMDAWCGDRQGMWNSLFLLCRSRLDPGGGSLEQVALWLRVQVPCLLLAALGS
ncbi:hypothetical protein YO5_13593 [Stutzerimonas stutzeri TS44]|nr:hypothetical protein YO5_13593 [Stutzerimonas stutzeri TS44]